MNLDIPLYASQIEDFADCKVVSYTDLRNYDVSELLNSLPIVILYKNNTHSGHYVCLFRNNYGIQYFDPYGIEEDGRGWLIPDSELNWPNFKKYSGSSKLIGLLHKIYESGVPVFANNIPYQIYSPLISTCGYHCIVRLMFSEFNEEDYYDIMNKLLKIYKCNNYDELVVKLLKNKL